MVVNYQFGKIYKIWSPSQDLQYIGSTTQELSQRLGGHKRNFKSFNNPDSKFNNYCASYEVLKCEDYRIDLLENYSCINKLELNKKEGEYIKNNVCVNKVIPGRTMKEHYHDNKGELLEKQKQYRKNNKEKISEKRKVKISCNCGSVFRKSDKARHCQSLKHQNYINSINI